MISAFIFIAILAAGVWFFSKNVGTISRNIKLGRDIDLSDNKKERWRLVRNIAIAQGKMLKNPIAGLLHIMVYVGFIVVNFEMLEILIDGIFHTHRFFAPIGSLYTVLINLFELFAVAVILACFIFLVRRNVLGISRFHSTEMTDWPRVDANTILVTEILLMSAFLTMNATDSLLQSNMPHHYVRTGNFLISSILQPLFADFSTLTLISIERFAWWFHIIGVLVFLNYIPYSKHFHVFLAFPNIFYSKLFPRTQMDNMDSVKEEVKIMLGMAEENFDENAEEEPIAFGAKDVKDLTWKQLMDSYTCTECGRCTASCPANLTGKKLSPRKIMMDTRDRLQQIGANIDRHGQEFSDGKSLFDYISHEELFACTTCNACTDQCPVNIDHVSVILEMRRYVVMEESAAPSPLNMMFTNIENNGAPWQYPISERANWRNDLFINEQAN